MKFSTEAKIISGIGAITLVVLISAIFILNADSSPGNGGNNLQKADQSLLIREDSTKIGSPSASLTIVEFADFQCPACAVAYKTLKEIKLRYPQKIQFVYRHFPLPMHKNAFAAAKAAEAAGEQGKFWEMHDLLFEDQKSWADSEDPKEQFSGYASKIGLEVERFVSDYGSSKYDQKITQDRSDGAKLGINGTPTIYINGEKTEGIPTIHQLDTRLKNIP